jgi:hypothetical protein
MAMKLELKSLRFSILWRPDEIYRHLADSKLSTLDLRMYTDYYLLQRTATTTTTTTTILLLLL